MDIKGFSFIKDEPILPGQPGYFDFYHKYFSPALKDMVLSDSCPHTIGLFSNWGTGKSSIIDQLNKDLVDENRARVFIFDAWKYQEDSLRRTFLIKLEKFLIEKKYEVPEGILSSFYKKKVISVATSREQAEANSTDNFFKKIWEQYKLAIICIALPFILAVLFNILKQYYPQSKVVEGINSVALYVNTLAWLGLIAGIFLKPVAEKAIEKISEKIFESTKSYTEVRTQTEEEDRLNSPEQFEHVFNSLVECVKKEEKLIIVFDNIDRVQGDVALKILSTIKTFLDPTDKSKVTFLVPCDADAINKQIKAFYAEQKDTDFDESEYLKKLFNVVIYTPEFIDDDLSQYTNSLIQQTGEIKEILAQEDVVSVITKAFKNNPREVKQFVNNLVSAILVASKTEVGNHILSEANIAYFTKVIILKQKFPKAYKKLRESWNEPEKIFDPESTDTALRDFLTLTSTVTTENAEPFIYFKAPQLATDLKDAESIRKSLIEGNVEEFEKLVSAEPKKEGVFQYVVRLLRSYKSQPRILLLIFKTQIQGFANLKESSKKKDYLEMSADTIELIWNNYLELPISLVFNLLPHFTNRVKRATILDRYVAVLSNEEIKLEANTPYLLDLIIEFIKNSALLSEDQRLKVVEAIRNNLFGRNDILLKFDNIEKQKSFVDPDILRKIIQEILVASNAKEYMPILRLYKELIASAGLGVLVVQRISDLIALQNSATPTTTSDKLELYGYVLELFNHFGRYTKEVPVNIQKEILNGLNTAQGQTSPDDELRPKIVNALRWLEIFTSDQDTKSQSHSQIENFINQLPEVLLSKVLGYWNEKSKTLFIQAYFAQIKARSVQDDRAFRLFYESASEDQKLELVKFVITGKSDHGLGFLNELGEKIPNRTELITTLLTKVQSLPIQQRVDVLNFLKGKIARNDEVSLKQAAIKQIYEYLKSNEQSMVQFGVTLATEKFLSDTDEREMAKEMVDFYNNRSDALQTHDLPALQHLVDIESKLQEVLREKLVYLVFGNIGHEKNPDVQQVLTSLIAKMKPDTDKYEKDYSDLLERIMVWPDSEEKDRIAQAIFDILKSISGSKAKEFSNKIKPLLKAQNSPTTAKS